MEDIGGLPQALSLLLTAVIHVTLYAWLTK